MPKNFAEVEHGVLYRGARPQPGEYAGLPLSGMKTIINLEGDDAAGDELVLIRTLNPTTCFVWLPISFEDIYVAGFPSVLLENLLYEMDSMFTPIYVHCQHGEDRTGLVIAAHRIRQGWKPQDAWDEAVKHGYRQHLNAGLNRNMEQLGVKLPALDPG